MVTIAGRSQLMPVVGYSSTLGNAWKLDPQTAKFTLRGQLPYNKDLLQPQTALLRYVLEQPYSRDMVCAMLGLSNKQKQRCPILEEQLVELIIIAMERSENDGDLSDTVEQGSNPTLFLWQHLSSHLIYFVLFHHASFPHMVLNLHDKLVTKNFRKGREHLMWVLLQFISGAIQKNPLVDFLPIMKLYDLLYPEKEPLPSPDVTKPCSTHAFAIASIWIHLMKKAEVEPVKLQRQLPLALQNHVAYLQENLTNSTLAQTFTADYRTSLLCNAFSTNQESFARPMAVLVEVVQGSRSSGASGTSTPVTTTTPLSMDVLDSLTVHTKMSLIHNIVTQIMKIAPVRPAMPLQPSLVETYSRLLIYTEIESLGIKGFMSQLLTTIFKSQSWGILHTLLEMFVYRLHHVPAHYRVQLLGQLHTLSNAAVTNQTQLHLCLESTALKLILGLSSAEVLAIPQFSRFNEPKGLISNESEELNKVLVLTLARAIHVTGSETLSAHWSKDLLTHIMQSTPLTWSSFTLMCFPPVIAEFFQQYPNRENKDQLKRSVEEEYRKWKAMSNENDLLSHFSAQQQTPLFLCLIWKMIFENGDYRINPIAYKIVDRIGARGLSAHLRTFCDFLLNEFANSSDGQHVKRCVDALNDLIWKCHVITLDRFLLCLMLRAAEAKNAQVCLVICMLILEKDDFRKRVEDFVRDNSPEHWKHSDWHEKHQSFQQKHPEKFYTEFLPEIAGQQPQHHPVYFSNVCLRFLPVLDIIIHRYLELVPPSIGIERILGKMGCLYKFHDRPVTYLYNTLHYYEQKLKDKPQLKRTLVQSVIGAFKDVRPSNWAMSEAYLNYMNKPADDVTWNDELDYYIKLIGRLVDTMTSNKSAFPHADWRFNEFPNACAHALHVTCIELMALPISASVVATNLINVVLIGHKVISRSNIESWMNAIGLVLTALPDSYSSVLMEKMLEMCDLPQLAVPGEIDDPFAVMDFCGSHNSMTEVHIGYIIGLTHAVWQHASVGQISLLPTFLKERVKPKIKTEEQFLFVCHLIGPFLQRFFVERTRIVMDVTIELYEMLGLVDRQVETMRYMDPICDLLYHIKYMFTGDSVKNEVETIIRNLRPQLQLRLRFITHLNIEELPIN